MIFQLFLNIAAGLGCFALLGSLPVRAMPFVNSNAAERWVYSTLLGLPVIGVVITLALSLHIPNRALIAVLWGLVILALGFVVRDTLRDHRWGKSRAEHRVVSLLFVSLLLNTFLQVAFVAYPDVRGLDGQRQMQRGDGLPSDCIVPELVADFIVHRRDPEKTAFMGDWRLSDRTPLMGMSFAGAEFMLGLRPYPAFVGFGTLMNTFFLLPAFLILRRSRPDHRAYRVFFALCTCLVFITLNLWFTWPKLLASAYVLLAWDWMQSRRSPWIGGALLALGWLSHPVVFFAYPGFLLMTALHARRGRRILTALQTALGLALTMIPWRIYSAFWNPDHSRLVRWHLFGEMHATEEPLRIAARRYFAQHGFAWILQTRGNNLFFSLELRPWFTALAAVTRHQPEGMKGLRDFAFFYLFGALDPLLAAAMVFGLWKIARQQWARPRELLGVFVLAMATWFVGSCFFGMPGNAVNHQYAYAAIVMFLLFGAWVAAELPQKWGVLLVGLVILYELFVNVGHLLLHERAPVLSTELVVYVVLLIAGLSLAGSERFWQDHAETASP